MNNTKIYGIIGPILSAVAEAVGLTAKNWNIAMVGILIASMVLHL